MSKTINDVLEDIKNDLLLKGRRALFVEPVSISTEITVVDTTNFQGYIALSDGLLMIYKNTFPFSDYALMQTLRLNETELLKSGRSLILRQYFVKVKHKRRKYQLTGISEPCMDAIVRALQK